MALQAFGGIVALLALLLGAQFGWQYYGSGLDYQSVTRTLERGVPHATSSEVPDRTGALRTTPPPAPGGASDGELIGWVRIPALGPDLRLPIQEGTEKTVLDNMGAGHYSGTAMPGQPGNSSYAGHATYSDFAGISKLDEGNEVIIETPDTWYLYKVTSHAIVDQSEVGVVGPDAAGAARGITLTTCWPVMSLTPATQRYVVHGAFEGWIPKSDGAPAGLAGTHRTAGQYVTHSVSTLSERVGVPVTGVMAACLALMWALGDGLAWGIWHKRMRERGRGRLRTASPMGWLWRIQAGPVGEGKVARIAGPLVRAILLATLLAALTFAAWRWACPWIAGNVPGFETPHPSIG
jgi:sortase A